MSADLDISFVRERVDEIRSALFFNRSTAPVMFSAGIINALELDEDGYIKFFISRPEFIIREDRRFPAELDFYRKGKPFYLKVEGIAELVLDEEEYRKYFEAFIYPINKADKRLALVKLKVDHVAYFEKHGMFRRSFLHRIRSQFATWF